jgi:hypothetical protein
MPHRYQSGALLPWVYYGLFGLLSVTGLRLGEALNRALADVDLLAAVWPVRGAKWGPRPAWSPGMHRPVRGSPRTSLDASTIGLGGPCPSPGWAPVGAIAWTVGKSTAPCRCSHARSVCAAPRIVADHACTTCATDAPRPRWCTGIAALRTPYGASHSCRPPSAMCTVLIRRGPWRPVLR